MVKTINFTEHPMYWTYWWYKWGHHPDLKSMTYNPFRDIAIRFLTNWERLKFHLAGWRLVKEVPCEPSVIDGLIEYDSMGTDIWLASYNLYRNKFTGEELIIEMD